MINGGGSKNRKDARLVELMIAAENCADHKTAELIIHEAYMLGHTAGADMMIRQGEGHE